MRGCIKLKLYISGHTVRSDNAISHLRSICEEMVRGGYEIRVIDVTRHPDQAEIDGVLATPTLIKDSPPPAARLIGDLSDRERVVTALDLRCEPAAHGAKSL
jgi:circadian clock protein KaiB